MDRSVVCQLAQGRSSMNPKNREIMELVLALTELDNDTYATVRSLVFGVRTEWQRLVAGARISEVVGQIEARMPIEADPISDGVLEVNCPKGKFGQEAFNLVLSKHRSVGPGSALLHIAVREVGGGSKLVITDHPWNNTEDGHTYVAVYDQESGSIYPELIGDLDSSHKFLVRSTSLK